jgi:hypothetical protein
MIAPLTLRGLNASARATRGAECIIYLQKDVKMVDEIIRLADPRIH